MAADPFQNLTDEEVLGRAAKALREAAMYAPGSPERMIQWGFYESAKAEIDLRLARHILAALELRERP